MHRRRIATVKPLHIAASLRVVAKHKHMPRIPIETAREAIQRAAAAAARTHEEQRMVDELERVTGMPVADLAKLTEQWPKE